MILSKTLSSAGLTFDAVGGIFLAIEAIKLDNLITLRDQVLPAIRLSFESPRFADKTWSGDDYERNGKRGFGGRSRAYVAFHVAAGLAVVFIVDALRLAAGIGPSSMFWTLLWHWQTGWRWFVLAGSTFAIAFVLPFTVGCWVHHSVERLLGMFISALVIIERGTPSGATGIIGALVFLTGFSLQLAGVWA